MLLRTLADYAAIAIENARAVQRIQELSITDDCTGLYNARQLSIALSDEVHRSERFGYEFSLLFLDLDYFKRVNDEHGHLVGSKLLGQVGQALRENLRLVDAAFRYGGDEFAILLPQTSKDAALLVARRLMALFHSRQWLAAEGVPLSLRASIGIASYPVDAVSPQAVVQRADEMMYQVKQAGRDNIALAGVGIVGSEEAPPSPNPPVFSSPLSRVSLFRLRFRSGFVGLHRIWICRSVGIDAEVPDVKIHLLWAEHLHHRVLARREILCRSHFHPLSHSKLFNACGYRDVLLAYLSGEGNFQIGDDARVFLDCNA